MCECERALYRQRRKLEPKCWGRGNGGSVRGQDGELDFWNEASGENGEAKHACKQACSLLLSNTPFSLRSTQQVAYGIHRMKRQKLRSTINVQENIFSSKYAEEEEKVSLLNFKICKLCSQENWVANKKRRLYKQEATGQNKLHFRSGEMARWLREGAVLTEEHDSVPTVRSDCSHLVVTPVLGCLMVCTYVHMPAHRHVI